MNSLKYVQKICSYYSLAGLGFCGFSMLALSALSLPAQADEELSRYEQIRSQVWHEARGERMGVFVEDVNVWIYRDRFRERFRMPEAWQSQKLKGTEALAWRTEPTGRLVCDKQSQESQRCLPVHECVMETYLPRERAGKLALSDRNALRPWKSSASLLLERSPEAAEYAEASIRLPKAEWRDAKFPVEVLRYDQSVRSGEFTNIVFLTDCRLGWRSVDNPSALILSAYAGQGRIEIDIPRSFWERVSAYMDDKRQHQRIREAEDEPEDNSLWLYTRQFARRFDLPEDRVSDELMGLEAVAFRVEPEGFSQCGYFGDVTSCNYAVGCKFDLYFKSDTPVVYTSDQRMQHRMISDTWRILPRWKYERRENAEGKHINSMLDMAGMNWVWSHTVSGKKDGGTTAHTDRYWRDGALLPDHDVLVVGSLCAVDVSINHDKYLIFSSRRLAPSREKAFREDTGVVYRMKLPAEFEETADRKAIYEEKCLYKSSIEDVVLGRYKGQDRRNDEDDVCSKGPKAPTPKGLLGGLRQLLGW